MGLLDKIFKKKKAEETVEGLHVGDTFISTGDRNAYKIVRELTEKQKELIEHSTLLLMNSTLYMHYWTAHLECTDPNDPEWQNKVLFFWKAEEPFPQKSLPPQFNTFQVKQFIFTGDVSRLNVTSGKAIPWFGMPGGGHKHHCFLNDKQVTIPELSKLGFVKYLEFIELTEDNSNVLTDKENYYFFVDPFLTPFHDGNFHLNGTPVSIEVAYSIGGIQLVKEVQLEE